MELPDAVAMTLEMLEVETEPEEIHETLVDVGVPTALAKELVRGCTIAFASLDDDPEESALIDHLCAEGIDEDLAEVITLVIFDEAAEDPEVNLAKVDGIYVMELIGELVEAEPEHLKAIADMLERVWAEDCRLAVDVTQLEFARADVLGVIIRDAATATHLGGEIVFYGFHHELLAYAEQIHLADIVTLVETREQALARLAGLTPRPLGEKRLSVKAGERDGVRILAPRGSIDPRTLERFKAMVDRELESREAIVLDCRDVTWVSSAAFGYLVQKAGKVQLVRLGGPLRLMHEMLGLGALIPAHGSRRDAIAAIKG